MTILKVHTGQRCGRHIPILHDCSEEDWIDTLQFMNARMADTDHLTKLNISISAGTWWIYDCTLDPSNVYNSGYNPKSEVYMDIKQTLEVVALVKALGEKMEAVGADGKVTILEVLAQFPGLVAPGFAAIKDANMVAAELKDLDALEIQTLVAACMDAVAPFVRLLGVKQA